MGTSYKNLIARASKNRRWNVLSQFCWSSILVILMATPSGGQVPQDHSGDDSWLSMIDAVVANCSAWKQVDVVIRETVHLDNTTVAADGEISGQMLKVERLDRIIFDLDQRQFAWFQLGVQLETEFGPLPEADEGQLEGAEIKPKETTQYQLDGWVCSGDNGQIGRYRNGEEPTRWRRDRFPVDHTEMLRMIRFPDIRVFWLYQRLVPWNTEPEQVAALLRSGKTFKSASENGHTVRLAWETTGVELPDNVSEMEQFIVMDVEHLIPIRAGFQIRTKDGRIDAVDPATFKWAERNGIQVPVSLRSQFSRSSGMRYVDLDLEWRTLNEPIDPNLFSLDRLKGPNAIALMVDPDRKILKEKIIDQPAKPEDTRH